MVQCAIVNPKTLNNTGHPLQSSGREDLATNSQTFQSMPNAVQWRLHFRSPADKVYSYLDDADKRRRFWSESAAEADDIIHFVFLNAIECFGRVRRRVPNRLFVVEYFDWTVTFTLDATKGQGCDLTMRCDGVADEERCEAIAGWVSLLMAMKAAVDFDVDLRNHDRQRTWYDGFADN